MLGWNFAPWTLDDFGFRYARVALVPWGGQRYARSSLAERARESCSDFVSRFLSNPYSEASLTEQQPSLQLETPRRGDYELSSFATHAA